MLNAIFTQYNLFSYFRNEKLIFQQTFLLLKNREFLLESFKKINVILFHHIINFYTNKTVVRNDSSKTINISKNLYLESITEMIYDDCFRIAANEIYRTMKTSKQHCVVAMFTILIKFTSIDLKRFEFSTY